MASARTKRLLLMAKLQKIDEKDGKFELFRNNWRIFTYVLTYLHLDSSDERSESDDDTDVDPLFEPPPSPVYLGSNFRESSSSMTSESEAEVSEVTNLTSEWNNCVGNHCVFEPNYLSGGVNSNYMGALIGAHPIDYFEAFIDNEIIDLMVDQTNLYATQVLCSGEDIPAYSTLRNWNPTSRDEIKHFIGLLAYMGLVRMPTLRHYWSRKPMFHNDFVAKVMPRNRFETLLQLWHFSNNDACPPNDRLFKVQPLLDLIVQKFQGIYTPLQDFCIDESLIPFRGRLVFKQYIPQKTHKYGVKMFKLCSSDGYTWAMKLYCGKERDAKASVPTNVVMTLAEKLLNQGRTVFTDNYYTSLDLANKLLDKQTHLVGTLRKNRRGNPKEVIAKKLKRGEIIARENKRGITVLKWRDKRDVLLLSTKHSDEMTEVAINRERKQKPQAVMEYNKGKSSVDLSDQMASYNSALRRSIKWYRKIAIEIILGTTIVNAHFLYKKINQSNITITEFRSQICEKLLEKCEKEVVVDESQGKKRKSMSSHALDKKQGQVHKTRKYCRGCYAKKVKGDISKNSVKKVNTYCKDCVDQPHFCLDCFNDAHK